MPGSTRYRILSLDGGGVWAVIEMRALMRLYGEQTRGRAVLGQFDLVASNSAGSVMLAAMIEDYTLTEVLGLLRDDATRRTIFVPIPLIKRVNPVTWFLGPRWSTEEKLAGLRAQFPATGDLTLDALPAIIGGRQPSLMFIAFDYDRERAVFFRSNRASRAQNFTPSAPPSLVLAAHASSDAPVRYFDEPVTIAAPGAPARRFWDGGVGGYNNPVLAAVTEALANGIEPARIDVLSIGTGSTHRPLETPDLQWPLGTRPEEPAAIPDLKELAAAILDDPPDAASFIAHVALGQAMPADAAHPVRDGALVRMNPVATPVLINGEWQLPPPTNIKLPRFARLVDLDMDTVNQDDVLLIDEFAREWVADVWPNQAIRASGDGACEIGQPTFGAAMAAWRARTSA
jgi:hypothetical protein